MYNLKNFFENELHIIAQNAAVVHQNEGKEKTWEYISNRYTYLTGVIKGARVTLTINDAEETELTGWIEEAIDRLFEANA